MISSTAKVNAMEGVSPQSLLGKRILGEVERLNKPKDVSLYSVLQNSYKPQKTLGDYVLDESLSNGNQQVYYRPRDKKLLFSIAGTHNLSDVGTDLYLAGGNLKSTSRYKEAQNALEKAKNKYHTDATIVGHSLGGSVGQYIASPTDKVISYNKGATIGQKTRSNETAYRSPGDLVSLFGSSGSKTLGQGSILNMINPFSTAVSAHDTANLKDQNIFV